MDNIVQLDDHRGWLSGKAVCLHCGHEWPAVSPVGTYTDLECSKCNTHHGVMDFGIRPPTENIWVCDCGSELFFVATEGLFCRACGHKASFDDCIA